MHLLSLPRKTDNDNLCTVGWRWVDNDVLTEKMENMLGTASYDTCFMKPYKIIKIHFGFNFSCSVVRFRKGGRRT